MQYLYAFIFYLFFIFLIYKLNFFKKTDLSFSILAGVFSLKVFSGIVLALLYRYYYDSYQTSDVYKYYLDGLVIYDVLKENPVDFFKLVSGIGADTQYLQKYLENTEFWIKPFNYQLLNDNRFVIRIHALLNIISFGNFWVNSVIFSFLSFSGLTAIYKVFSKFFNKKYLLMFAVYFVPSVMFWASAALKESLLMAMLGLMFYNFFKLIERKQFYKSFLLFILSMFLMFLLKFYVLFSLLPGLIFYTIYKIFKNNNPITLFTTIYTLVILFFFTSGNFTKYDLPKIISNKQHDFINMVNATKNVGSKVDIPVLDANFFSILKATPNALINSFFRPFINDIHSIIVIPAVLENLIIIILFILSILFFNKSKLKNYLPEILFLSSFIITLFLLIGLTTPVLGALVRYKVPALPFLFILFLFFINTEKFKRFINIKKKLNLK